MAERSTGRRWPWFLLATGLLAASVGGAAALWLLRAQPEPQEPPPQAPYVELAHARATAEPLVVEGNGIVQPRAEIALSPQVGGRVEYVHPALVSGGAFSAGEVLVRIEDEDYRSRVRQAEATVAQRDVDLQRAREEARIARQELSNLRDRLESGRGDDGIEGDFVPSGGEGTDGAADDGASGEGVSPLTLRKPQIQAAEAALDRGAQLRCVELGPGRLDQLVVAHAGGTGADAGEAAEAAVEMARHRGIELQLAGRDLLEGVDATPRRIHLRAQHPVAGTGGQAEAAVHAGVGGVHPPKCRTTASAKPEQLTGSTRGSISRARS